MAAPEQEKRPRRGRQPVSPQQPGPGLWTQLAIALAIFLVLSFGYSLVREYITGGTESVPISQIAADISADKVAEITVRGNTVMATYKDETKKDSRKETESSLTETLAQYNISPEKLAAVKIGVEDEGGFRFWFLTLVPILVPALLLFGVIWYLSRQLRGGGGMQAFTFGRSMARLVSPEDTVQRVTFADVAGAKEAKAELSEIVDFLKNPKKFIQIGARIPKGVLLMGGPGTGKCVTGDTQVLTSKGLFPIRDIPLFFSVDEQNGVEGLRVCSVDPDTLGLSSARASHWYDLGEQATIRMETDLGTVVEGTPEHPIVVVDEHTGQFAFRRIDEIREGDYAVVAYNTRMHGSYTRIPHADVAYMLGIIIGDGCMTTKNRLAFTSADGEIVDRMQKITHEHFGILWRKGTSRPYDYEMSDASIKRTIISYGLAEVGAEHKRLPLWVKVAPQEHMSAFLRGLFDTDGYVEKRGAVGLSSASRTLIDEVHAALLNLGIVARIHSRKKLYNGHLQHYVTVYGDFLEPFQQEIGFTVARKRERLASLVERQRNTNINVIPHQGVVIRSVWNEARAMTADKLDRAFYAQSLYKNVKRYIAGERSPSPRGMRTFIAGVTGLAPALARSSPVNFLKTLSSGTYFFTKITKKENGYARVFDLTVPQSHNFVANGLVNHNTLLARAVAGEAGVPFFSISGSEFVEMFVGVGASRVRDLFQTAKKAAPAIVFIDEIDAVGRVRGTGVGGGNDEREQTLNQILVEMDGFEPNEKVIVMAASNRPDVLDPALLRPGRFDRRVVIDLPDRKDREDILTVHARKKPLGPDVKLATVAERTPGFSGADLANLMNEGAILAAREDRKEITQYDLIRSIEKVMLGPERRSHLLNKKEKEITAYHEAGHALIASVLPYADPVHKISIISRGRAAGYTLKLPLEETKMQSRREFIDDIAVSLGGFVAERIVFGDVTTGASNDLQVLSALARNMVARYGMSEKLGPIAFEGSPQRALFGEGVENEQSETVATAIDAEVKRIVEGAQRTAEEVIERHRGALDAIARRLIEVETIEQQEFETMLLAHGITPKKKQDIEHAPLA